MKKFLTAARFLIAFLILFIIMDCLLCHWSENHFHRPTNDFEVTRHTHPEETWDKVFFGNSTVIAGYREDISEAGYVNLGVDYGVVTDLWDMMRKRHIDVGSELVVGLNLFTLYDDFDTNPAYIWHRDFYEPYAYFHRDKLLTELKLHIRELLGMDASFSSAAKILYYGSMSDEELEGRLKVYRESYYNLPESEFSDNIEALYKIADRCEKDGVRLRIIWMPNNPSTKLPPLYITLQEQINEWASARGIDVLDCTALLDETCFYDVGHLNYEYGAQLFTKEVDKWLLS